MKQFFKDGNGELSMMRLLNFMVVSAILLVFVAVNGVVLFNALKVQTPVPITQIVDFSIQAFSLIIAVLGIKVAQGYLVEKGDKPAVGNDVPGGSAAPRV